MQVVDTIKNYIITHFKRSVVGFYTHFLKCGVAVATYNPPQKSHGYHKEICMGITRKFAWVSQGNLLTFTPVGETDTHFMIVHGTSCVHLWLH